MKTIKPGQITLPGGITLWWDNPFTQTPMRGKQAWLDELKVSRQCHGALEKVLDGVVSNCCLGVLCRVEGLPRSIVNERVQYVGDQGFYRGKSGVSSTGRLPTTFRFKCDGRVGRVIALAYMNDQADMEGTHLFSFTDISVVIDLCFCEEVAK